MECTSAEGQQFGLCHTWRALCRGPKVQHANGSVLCPKQHCGIMARRRRDEETAPLRQPVGRREDAQQMLNQQGGVPQFTLRATLVGLLVGTLVCFSNMYFGLQSEFPGGGCVSTRIEC